jgi:hypothetical protein
MMLLLVSCESLKVEELRPDYPVVTAVLQSGNTASEISLFTLTDVPGQQVAITDAIVRVRDEHGAEKTAVFNNGKYRVSNFLIGSGRTYHLLIGNAGEVYTSSCVVPPELVLVNLSNNVAHIDTATNGAPILTVTWNELPSELYSYALLLEPLDEEPELIPFTQETGGQFAALNQSPILNNTITLFDTDFKYYGPHLLSIFAIERGLEHLYFYDSSDLRGLLQTAPSNVKGAHGYFTGVSRLTVDLLIQH